MSDQSTPTVEYRLVPNFPGYRVGDDGTVWSQHKSGSKSIPYEWTLRKPWRNNSKYFHVDLRSSPGKKCVIKLHHLVLIAFGFKKPFSSAVVRHLNGDPSDNRLCNLKWGTMKENGADSVLHGSSRAGEKHRSAKLTNADVEKIRYKFDGVPHVEVAKMFGVSPMTIGSIRKRRTWKHLA